VKLGLVNDARGKPLRLPEEVGVWIFDEDDYLLLALLCDPIYCAELLGEDPSNHDYGGAYVVRDYQYPLFRLAEIALYAGATCARTVGKTESVKWRAVSHAFKRIAENLLVTAPELIHLLPLTDAIEDIYRRIRLLRDFLDLRGGKTGFTHRPFGIDLTDGTKIVGRIPRLTGTGVKGQHQPDLIVDEGQDYPEKGWTEVHETVLKDHVDQDGNPDFTYHFYGVHSGATDSGFHKRSKGASSRSSRSRPCSGPAGRAPRRPPRRAAYGGSQSPDYKRNILGEQGGGASQIFVTSRLVACLDQDRESKYNTVEVVPTMLRDPDNEKKQLIRAEEFDELDMLIGDILDLPSGYSKRVWGGLDFGLTAAPTVITLFHEEKVKGTLRLKLIRRIHFERMRTKTIREALYAIAWHFGGALRGFGMDVTGLGFPIWQEMEDDESCPPAPARRLARLLLQRQGPGRRRQALHHRGRPGPAARPVRRRRRRGDRPADWSHALRDPHADGRGVDALPAGDGRLRPADAPLRPGDHLRHAGRDGAAHPRISGLKNKPNAFHILDAMRGMAMVYNAGEIEAELEYEKQVPVLDAA
jgi:hypothetical protein